MLKKAWTIDKPIELLVDKDSYIIEGKKYFRVTRVKSIINQPGLNYWRAKVGLKKSKEIMVTRGTFGTNFHKLSEIILGGHRVNAKNYGEEMEDALKVFTTFVKEHNIQMEACEQSLWYDEVGGTADFIGVADLEKLGKKAHVILDWKTSSGVYDDYWLQIACYVMMFEKMTGVKLDGAAIVHIKDGKLKIYEKTYDELLSYYEVFLHCIIIFKYTKGDF